MKFLVILTCVAINRYWVGSHPLHTEEWFEIIKEKLWANQLDDVGSAYGQFTLVVILPVVVIGCGLYAIQSLFWGLLWMVPAFMVLGYSIGVSNLDELARNHILWLRKLTPDDDLSEAKSHHEDVMQTMVRGEFVNIYPILFWFLVAGPAGALLYRLTDQYSSSKIESQDEAVLVARLLHAMDWIPVRITGIAFCVVGDFGRCVERVVQAFTEWALPGNEVLVQMVDSAIADIEMDSVDVVHFAVKADYKLKEAALLLHRTLLFWIALIAVITLLGWVG